MKTRLLRVLLYSFLLLLLPLCSYGQQHLQVSKTATCPNTDIVIYQVDWPGATGYSLTVYGVESPYDGLQKSVTITGPTEIILKAFDDAGGLLGDERVFINTSPHINIHGDQSRLACPGEEVMFEAHPSASVRWVVTDPVQTVFEFDGNMQTHVFDQLGGYNVAISGEWECGTFTDEATFEIASDLAPLVPEFMTSRDSICPGESIRFTSHNYYQSGIHWAFGDGATGFSNRETEHVFSGDQPEYAIEAKVTNACQQTSVHRKTIYIKPDIVPAPPTIHGPDMVCPNEQVWFSSDQIYNSYEWRVEGKSFTGNGLNYTFLTAGVQHEISLTVTNKCGNFSTSGKVVEVRSDLQPPEPVFSGGEQVLCPNEPAEFEANNTYKSYRWDFGDGTRSHSKNPEHFWGMDGSYEVRLTVTNGCNLSSDTAKVVSISLTKGIDQNLQVDDFPSKVCPGEPVSFRLDNGFKKVVWHFGDGATAEGKEVTHAYNQAQVYTPRVTVTNYCGVKADLNASHAIEVSGTVSYDQILGGPPYIFFGMGGESEGGSNQNRIYCPGESILMSHRVPGMHFVWDFGDQSTAEGEGLATVSHSYGTAGTHIIRLTATSGCNQQVEVIDSVIIGERDQFYIPIDTEGATICPGGFYSVLYPSTASVLFDFGDNSEPAYPEIRNVNGIDASYISHQYNVVGDYVVKLKGTDACGNVDSTTVMVHVIQDAALETYPLVEITSPKNTFTTCDKINFSIGGEYAATYHFGDGQSVSATDPFVAHTFAAPGPYGVYAEFTTGCGGVYTTDSLMVYVETCPQPTITADFISDNVAGQIPFTVQFTDQSTISSGTILSWAWDFNGDGVTDATTQNPSITFDSKGQYPVSLTVSDGVISSTYQLANPIIAYDCNEMTVDFTVADACLNTNSIFQNKSVAGSGAGIVSYSWDMDGDGVANYTTENASHLFANAGIHSVVLTATSQYCEKSISKSAKVEYADVSASAASAEICGSDSIIYVSGVVQAGQTANWITRGAGSFRLNTPTEAEYRVAFEDKQNKRVTLVLIGDAPSCVSNRDSVTIQIFRRPIVAVGPNQAITADPVFVDATVFNANQVYWTSSGTGTFDPGQTSVDITYTPSADDLSEGNVKLTLVASNPVCPPVANRLVLSSNTVICNVNIDQTANQNLITFVATNDDNQTVGSYLWDFGDGHEASGRIQSNVYNQPGTYYVKLSYSAPDSSCTAISYDSVYVSEAAIPTYTISGNVKVSGTFLDAGKVTLFKFDGYNYDFLRAKDITASENGSFIFTGLENGYYLVHALPDTISASFDSYVATYYGNATEWENGDFIKINNADFTSAFINLTPYTPGTYNSGSDIIQGTVVFDINSNLKVTQGSENPVENAVVTLYNSTGDRLTSTYTDPYGNYSFENMGPGEYFVDVEYAGTNMTEDFSINADGSGTTHDGSTSVAKQDIALGNKPHTAVSALNVYPNPVNEYAVVKLPATITGAVHLKVFTVSGLLVKELSTNAIDELTISTDELKEGMYLLNIETETGKWLVRFSKH